MGSRALVALCFVAACSFTPSGELPGDGGGGGSGSGGSGSGSGSSGSGSGSGSGSAVGSGSGSDTWPCGSELADPGSNGGENDFSHGWSTKDMTLDGSNSRLAVIAAGSDATFQFGYTVWETCQDQSCPVQLQIGTNQAELGCIYDAKVSGQKITTPLGSVYSASVSDNGSYTITFGQSGIYTIYLDDGSRSDGCGTNWIGSPGSHDVVAYVCVP